MDPIESWLSEEELSAIYSAGYWNDISQEQKKEWWIADGHYDRCLAYLDRSGLMAEYLAAEKMIVGEGLAEASVLDLAAGTGWTTALLTKIPGVSKVLAVEISKHRLGELFEHSFKMLGGEEMKARRFLGSFYDIQLPDSSVDVVFMSQAFHHADRPFALLQQCDRVLKPGGLILLVGEHFLTLRGIARRFLKHLLQARGLPASFQELFPPDDILGDHYYRRSDYYFLFGAFGYEVRHQQTSALKCIYAAHKRR